MMAIPRSEGGNQLQWAVSAPLIAAAITGIHGAVQAVLVLALVSTAYYWIRLRSFMAYRVQVRIGFSAFVALGLVPGLELLLWVPLFGTTAQLLFGYCPMARLLDLAPWNRSRPFTFALVWGIATRSPGGEGLLSTRRARDGFSCKHLAPARQSILTNKR